MTRPTSLNIFLLSESDSLASLDRRALRDAGASRVECMTSGIDAARMLAGLDTGRASFMPDVVVCTQRLSDMDGEQFCAILRQHPLLLDLPILLILPNDGEVEQLKTLGCGASALLARPYSINILKAHLESLTASRPSLQQLETAQRYTDTSSFDQALATYGILLKPVRGPEDYFRVGMQCLQQRQWNNAINAFQRALRGALIQGHAELGMAVAWKGKGDVTRYRHYLGQAAITFVRARHWHRARAVYAGLLKEDPEAKSPFLAETFQMMRQGQYDEAAEILAQGYDVTPRRQLTERVAQTCLGADEPQHMLAELEASLGRVMGMAAGPLTEGIRSNLENLARQQEDKKRQEAAESQWLAARQAARQRENAEQSENIRDADASKIPASIGTGSATEARVSAITSVATPSRPDNAAQEKQLGGNSASVLPVPLWGQGKTEFMDMEEDSPSLQARETSKEFQKNENMYPLEPMGEASDSGGHGNGKSGLGDLLSVMKYTWKMARRHKQ
ncbi:MAG: histidine kinase [Desulfovibrio sp.]|uniref:histidine kinase n=1 Tax=Desulfovibrio sp. TaxID=885 RepID=UPI0039E5728F